MNLAFKLDLNTSKVF